ncbi:DUF1345 domain-containing protein [Plantactinospora siamensis]|uniref:DUF1345 domain-containing protein n=1 Tax=Plantactinospora siamensis TaxID=555372 RepID=A0ABV6NTD4_9ACTN
MSPVPSPDEPAAAEHPHRVPAWRRPHPGEHRWPVALVILVAVALQLVTPQRLAFEPRWVLPAVELVLLAGLLLSNPFRINRESGRLRTAELALVGVASLAVAWSAGRLVLLLVHGQGAERPASVLISGAAIWLTNVIVFALWYWELDRGGPAARANSRQPYPDLLFPQMTTSPDLVPAGWRPVFADYLYVAFTNSTAFSPTDTMPLSRLAKLAMMLQSAISFLVVALVVARAVNALT